MLRIKLMVFASVILECFCDGAKLNVLGQCLKMSSSPSVMDCVGQQAIHSLQLIEDMDNFTITSGLMMLKEEGAASRSIPNFLDQDPLDFRGILENAGAVFGQRSLKFDMSKVYPGLNLRVGPTDEASSILEFVMEPGHAIDERRYLGDEPSTARILTKKFILPFLLGLKFNLVALVPLIFAGVIVLCKKAALLAKLALFLSSIFGFGGALSLGALSTGYGSHGGDGHHGSSGGIGGILTGGYGGYGHHSPGLGSFGDHLNHQSNGYYRNERNAMYETKEDQVFPEVTVAPDRFYNFEKNVLLKEQNRKLIERSSDEFVTNAGETTSYRDFAWKTL